MQFDQSSPGVTESLDVCTNTKNKTKHFSKKRKIKRKENQVSYVMCNVSHVTCPVTSVQCKGSLPGNYTSCFLSCFVVRLQLDVLRSLPYIRSHMTDLENV